MSTTQSTRTGERRAPARLRLPRLSRRWRRPALAGLLIVVSLILAPEQVAHGTADVVAAALAVPHGRGRLEAEVGLGGAWGRFIRLLRWEGHGRRGRLPVAGGGGTPVARCVSAREVVARFVRLGLGETLGGGSIKCGGCRRRVRRHAMGTGGIG